LPDELKSGILPPKTKEEEMPAKIHKVPLTNEERAKLTAIVSKGKGNVRRIRRAQMLLLADENQPDGAWKDADIAKALSAHA
jgi:hypothetical protein